MGEPSSEIPLAKAARGTLATLVLRLVSFACTQWTFRVIDATTLGQASIQLELVLTTVLFISREGFRLSLTRNLSSENWNVAWLSIPVSTVFSLVGLLWHLGRSHAESSRDFWLAGILYCIAAWVEAAAEPAVLFWLRKVSVSQRASAEGLATLSKTFAIFLALQQFQNTWPVSSFGMAQVVYAAVYSTYLYATTWSKLKRPHFGSFEGKTVYLTMVFTAQGFFKHLLTEGDRIVLTAVSESYNQGIYAMGSSYGGLAARTVLQPLEENARLLWSRLATADHSKSEILLEQSYVVLMKIVLYIGMIFGCFAVNYTSVLLNLLAGRKWGNNTEAIAVLSAFCVYTAFLAWNGMSEAFIYGVAATGTEMGKLGVSHTAIGLVYACAAPFLVAQYGTVGLVGANCFAMLIRAMYATHYAASYFAKSKKKPFGIVLGRLLRQSFPHWVVAIALVSSYFATRLSLWRMTSVLEVDKTRTNWFISAFQHIVVGVICFLGVAGLAYTFEKDFQRSLRSMLREKSD